MKRTKAMTALADAVDVTEEKRTVRMPDRRTQEMLLADATRSLLRLHDRLESEKRDRASDERLRKYEMDILNEKLAEFQKSLDVTTEGLAERVLAELSELYNLGNWACLILSRNRGFTERWFAQLTVEGRHGHVPIADAGCQTLNEALTKLLPREPKKQPTEETKEP